MKERKREKGRKGKEGRKEKERRKEIVQTELKNKNKFGFCE